MVAVIVFFVMRVAPGDPAVIQIGLYASEEQIEIYRQELGLKDPLVKQFANYIRNLFTGEWGYSYYQQRPVVNMIVERLPATLLLFVSAITLAIFGSIVLGVASAIKANSLIDRFVVGFSLLGQSMPNFWIGLVLILVFSRMLGWFPSYGMGSLNHLVLPSITYALVLIGMLTRLVRTSMLEQMKEDYVRTARSKGLSEMLVFVKHVLRNSLIPWVTYLGIMIGEAIGGVVVIETVFSWPGIGRLLIDSLQNRDYPVVEALIVLSAVSIVVVNLVVDLLYGWLDPRIIQE